MNSRNIVCVIVHDQTSNRVAALHYAARSWLPQPTWTIPGGKAEAGEPLDEAAARELKEETGLVVAPADLELVHVIHVEQGWDGRGQLMLFVFATAVWSGALVNTEPNKHLAASWIDASALPQPAFPTAELALAAYTEGRKGLSRYGWGSAEDNRLAQCELQQPGRHPKLRGRPPRN